MNKGTFLSMFMLSSIFCLEATEDLKKEGAGNKLASLSETLTNTIIVDAIKALNNVDQIDDLLAFAKLCKAYKEEALSADKVLVQCFERGICDTYEYLSLPPETRSVYRGAGKSRAEALAQARLRRLHRDSWQTAIDYYGPGARWLETAQEYEHKASSATHPPPL
jgi:hypothetical protein